MTKPIISVENLSKAYRLGVKEEAPDTLVGAMTGVLKAPFKNWKRLSSLDTQAGGDSEDILWALKDVSFDVHEGEVVGIIGRNGAGKSTLLKILSRITDPTSGCVKLRGRVSSLLEVGTGFHPELTGRDNVYMNGTILGMAKQEIDKKFDEIVDFSGVEKFLDTPVKRYSSGMLVRLAFAVAAHLEPEILIVDEVLAVGDAEFQNKCLGKMQDVSRSGRTVLFVSHNMAAFKELCSRGVLLADGQVDSDGISDEIADQYLSSMNNFSLNPFSDSNLLRTGNGRFRFTSADVVTEDGRTASEAIAGDPLRISLAYKTSLGSEESISIAATIYNQDGVAASHFNTNMTGGPLGGVDKSGRIVLIIPECPLPKSVYRFAIGVHDLGNGELLDHLPNALSFSVYGSRFYGHSRTPSREYCAVMMHYEWQHIL